MNPPHTQIVGLIFILIQLEMNTFFKGRIKALKFERDAFGQMIWAYYGGKEVFEVWERNDGYISVDLVKTYFSEYEDWALHQRKAMEFVRGRVLDVGCGAGRHSLYLQKLGFDVLGIDVSPLAARALFLDVYVTP